MLTVRTPTRARCRPFSTAYVIVLEMEANHRQGRTTNPPQYESLQKPLDVRFAHAPCTLYGPGPVLTQGLARIRAWLHKRIQSNLPPVRTLPAIPKMEEVFTFLARIFKAAQVRISSEPSISDCSHARTLIDPMPFFFSHRHARTCSSKPTVP